MTLPAVKIARAAVGAKGSRPAPQRHAAADPRVAAPGSAAAKQRQSIEDIKSRRPPAPETPAAPPPASPGDGTAGRGLSLPGMPAAAASGSGFLLGVFAWALGLAYLRGGAPEVRRFMSAKFLNKV